MWLSPVTTSFCVQKRTNFTVVTTSIHFKNGEVQNETLLGCIDSIFLNFSSYEKFVFPYYSHVYGAEFVKKMRDDLIIKYKENESVQNYENESAQTLSAKSAPPGTHINITYGK